MHQTPRNQLLKHAPPLLRLWHKVTQCQCHFRVSHSLAPQWLCRPDSRGEAGGGGGDFDGFEPRSTFWKKNGAILYYFIVEKLKFSWPSGEFPISSGTNCSWKWRAVKRSFFNFPLKNAMTMRCSILLYMYMYLFIISSLLPLKCCFKAKYSQKPVFCRF